MENVRYYDFDNSNITEFYNEIRRNILNLDENEYPYFIFNVCSVSDTIHNLFFRYDDDTFEYIPVSLKEKDEEIVDFVCIEDGKIKKLISNLKI